MAGTAYSHGLTPCQSPGSRGQYRSRRCSVNPERSTILCRQNGQAPRGGIVAEARRIRSSPSYSARARTQPRAARRLARRRSWVLATSRLFVAKTLPRPPVSARISAVSGTHGRAISVLQIARYHLHRSRCLKSVLFPVRSRTSNVPWPPECNKEKSGSRGPCAPPASDHLEWPLRPDSSVGRARPW
jgi:hypothetical protein